MALPARNAAELEAEIHILPYRFPREQRRLLEDDAAIGPRSGDWFSINLHNASLRWLESGDRADQA